MAIFLFIPVNIFAADDGYLENETGLDTGGIIKKPQIRRCLTAKSIDTGKAELSGKDYPTGQKIYIVDCIPTANNFICTTGSTTNDDLLGITTSNPPNFTIIGSNPVVSTDGKINTTASVDLAYGQTHLFYGTILLDANNPEGNAKSLQMGAFNFFDQDLTECVGVKFIIPTATPAPTATPGPVTPTAVPPDSDGGDGGGGDGGGGGGGGDPYGRVFDAVSLEPIPNISVEILNNEKKHLNISMLVNPQTTKEDGIFNFVVPVGFYYLNPTLNNYTFASASAINPNYIRAYSDILKSPDEKVFEKSISEPTHKDIALDPGNNPPYRANPTKINYGTIRVGEKMVVIGRVSHPLTIVKFSQNGKQLGYTNSNRWGAYKVSIDIGKIDPNTQIKVDFEKVDLSGNAQTLNIFERILAKFNFFEKANAQTLNKATKSSGFFIDPIPSYIEGIAYDSQNNIANNSYVNLKLTNSDQIYYQTKADENGKFTIDPKYIPAFAYRLEIVNPQTKENVKNYTITEFSKSNFQYLAENKINLMTATKDNKKLIIKNTSNNTIDKNIINKTEPQKTTKEQIKSNSVLFTLMVLFSIIIVIVITFIYFYKRQHSQIE